MTETAKTVLFIAAAAVSLAIALKMGPTSVEQNLEELVGQRLNQFEVDVAKRLKIVKFEKETASTREFEVTETEGLWSIPSKQGYPADAAKQMAEAATCLMDREVLRVAGKNASAHEDLGVIAPDSSKLDSKAQGVGLRVTITDANDDALTDMIIGKPVKDTEGQYYVRNANQDVVYVVNLDPDKLSTKFEDWIEDDLLKLSPMDIQRVNIKDYTAELQPVLTPQGLQMQVNWDRRGEMLLTYDQAESKWQSEQLQKFDPEKKELVAYQMAEDEVLNKDNLSELRSGLDDLLLVDVERKPEGLSADLKAGSDFLQNQEAATSLIGRGFAPLSLKPGTPPEILSSEGEIICTLKDGVEYVLRFGNLQIGEGGESSGPSTTTDSAEETDEKSDDGINRYLFVMARFNESMLEKPTLTDLPELPESSQEKAADDEAEAAEDSSEEQGTTADEETPEEKTEGQESAEEDTEESDKPATKDEGSDSDRKKDDTEEASAEKDEAKSKAEEELATLIAEREAIEKENQRLLDEYQDQLEAGRERVKELNERFGDWYYVISNDVYKKIHLSLDQVISKKEEDAEKETTETDTATPAGLPGLPNLPLGSQ